MVDHDYDLAFAELMKTEHDDLFRTIDQVKAALHSDSFQRHSVSDKFVQLSELIESHFRHEEAGGYMQEAVARAPHLRKRAAKLQEQHVELQEEIDKLQLLVHSGVESASWLERIITDFECFAMRLREHEDNEARLIQEAYNQNIGTTE